MNDVLEAARRIVAWDDSGRLADDEWLVEKNETAIIAICRALLSSSAAERAVREALESIRYHSENQDISHLTFRIKARECAELALSARAGEEEQEQARSPSALSAPTDRL